MATTKQACERIILRPLSAPLREDLEFLFGTEYSPEEAAESLRMLFEHVLFTGSEDLPVRMMEALSVPWRIMNALQEDAKRAPK